MSRLDVFLLFLILLAVIMAFRQVIQNHRRGRYCCGDCSACMHSCTRKDERKYE